METFLPYTKDTTVHFFNNRDPVYSVESREMMIWLAWTKSHGKMACGLPANGKMACALPSRQMMKDMLSPSFLSLLPSSSFVSISIMRGCL